MPSRWLLDCPLATLTRAAAGVSFMFFASSLSYAAGDPAPPPGFSADTASSAGLMHGATASELGCRTLREALWVDTGNRKECLRYIASGISSAPSGETALVILSGDPAGAAYRSVNGRPIVEAAGRAANALSREARRSGAITLSALAGHRPVVLLARPGMQGSSGYHARDRHSRDEVALIDAALTALRRRYGFRNFALHGFSSGGTLLANLLAQRDDIRCAVIASAPLDLAAFYRAPDDTVLEDWLMRRRELADPMQAIGSPLLVNTEIFVTGDPSDRRVPASSWRRWATQLRLVRRPVVAEDVASATPNTAATGVADHHAPSQRGLERLLTCATREHGVTNKGVSSTALDHLNAATIDELLHVLE